MAKAIAFMLVMTLMVSTFTVRANALDLAGSGRSLLRLQFFTNFADEKKLSIFGAAAAPAPSTEAPAPAPSANGEKNGQTWVSWFEDKMSFSSVKNMFGSSNTGAPAPAPSA